MAYALDACTHGAQAVLARLRGAGARMRGDTRGGVALTAAVCFAPLAMVAGLGIELTQWTVVKAQLQRAADLAAVAGAQEYLNSSDPKTAAYAAADLAEANGVQGGTRSYDANSKILTSNQVTVQVGAGLRAGSTAGIEVTAKQVVPLALTRIMGATSPVTVAAKGYADVRASMQPCLLALARGGAGIQANGNGSAMLTGCGMRSNASISTQGSGSMVASGYYAAGSITGNQTGGPEVSNGSTLADPYATYLPVQLAFARAAIAVGGTLAEKSKAPTPLSPGSWSSWDIKGTVNLSSGIYYVRGDISLGAQAELNGTDVTIVAGGSIDMKGGSSLNLSAATTDAANKQPAATRAIPGVVFASSSSDASGFGGNSDVQLTGVVYYPNGALNFRGTPAGGSRGCLNVVAASITLQGNSSMASACADYGTLTFAGQAAVASLVR